MLKVSIVTVVRNEKRVVQTIQSVQGQTYQVEHIIVDGMSTDGTWELIEQNAPNTAILIHEKDHGIYDAINKGILKAKGDIVGFLNANDVFAYADVIKDVVAAFEADPALQATHANVSFHNEMGNVVRSWKGRDFEPGLFQKSWTPAHPTFYTYKKNYEKFGLYKTDYKIAADVELMFRYLEIQRLKSKFFNKVLVDMAFGGASTQGLKSTWIITCEMKRAFKDNGYKFSICKYTFHKTMKIRQLLKL